MKILGDNFVLGRTIKEALSRAAPYEARGYRFSYDMLGERAKTAADADRYFDRYMAAIEAIGEAKGPGSGDFHALMARPSVSVKLSAIHPRFEPGKEARLDRELLPRLVELAAAARRQGIGLTVDAEEQDRLDLTLGLFAGAFCDPALDGWPGLGLAVQAYGKRATPVLSWLQRLSQLRRKPIPVRLVKGAYWDSEIKWAQERGLARLPRVHAQGPHRRVLSRLRAPVAGRSGRVLSAVRHAQRAVRSPRSTWRPAGACSSSSGCTAWARRSTRRWSAAASSMCPAASTRRSARTRTSSPTWCAACSRTAPTPRSSTAWPTRRRRSRRSSAIPSRASRVRGRRRRRRLPRPPEIYAPERVNSAGLALSEPSVRGPLLAGDRGRAGALLRRRAHRRRPDIDQRGRRGAGVQPARPATPRRHGVHGRFGGDRGGDRRRARVRARLGPARRPRARADPRPRRRPLRARPRAPHGRHGARGRQDGGERAGRRARGRRLPALLRGAGAAAVRWARLAQGPHRRDQPARAPGPRAVRLHLALELPARHLHGPGGGGPGGGQSGARQAGRADADHGLPRRPAAARGGRAAGRPAAAARHRRRRCGPGQGPARGGRRLHRLQRDGLGHPAGAGRPARRHRPLHRRDRRPQRHDRR